MCALLGAAGCGDDDGGNQNNTNDVVICGNGVEETGEQCDDGAHNSDLEPDACRTSCRLPSCGDGVVDTGETCDEGMVNSDRIANACRTTCQEAGCGDGVLDLGEGCDDGNGAGEDGCDAECSVESGWACQGEPSVCTCAPHRLGDQCGQCVVYVSLSAPVEGADGLSWATAVTQVQDGIDRAAAVGGPCEVWVAAGRYHVYEHDHLDTVALADDVSLYGGFVGDETDRDDRDPGLNLTILDGVHPTEPALRVFHVMTAIGTRDATVDGFVVTGGRAFGLASSNDDRGGGLLAYSAQVLLDRCVFLENQAIHGGGAVYAYASGGLRFFRSVFSDNAAPLGGALHLTFSPVHVQRCTFQSNSVGIWSATSEGGAVYAQTSAAQFHRCRFLGNQAMFMDGSSPPVGRGGAMRVTSSNGFQVLSSVFLGNHASQVGALDIFTDSGALASSGLVANCTFANNWGELASALNWIYAPGGPVDPFVTAPVYSSAFLGNTVAAAALEMLGEPEYCLTQTDRCNGEPGCTSQVLDPGFSADVDHPLVASTWTALSYLPDRHQTVLEDNTRSWTVGALVGLYVMTRDSIDTSWRLIIDNDATSLRVWGEADATVNAAYRIVDLRLAAGSPAIDAGMDPAGDPSVAVDLGGTPWTDHAATSNTGGGTPDYVDIGAHEYIGP